MPWVRVRDLPANASPREVRQIEDYRRRRRHARFYAHENFPARATTLLRRWRLNVVTAQEAGNRRQPDENHLAYSRREDRILVTCDRDYLDEARFPLVHCPAVIVFNFGSGTEVELTRAFRCLAYVAEFPQFYDRWVKFDAGPNEWVALHRFQNGTTSRDRYRFNAGSLETWIE